MSPIKATFDLPAYPAGRFLVFFLLLFFAQPTFPQSFVRSGVAVDIGEMRGCVVERDCRFDVRGDSVVVSAAGELIKTSQPGYEALLVDEREEVRSAAISGSGNVIAIAIEKVTTGRRAFGRRMPRPDDLDRTYRIALHNPRSGSLIKSFDFGTKAVRSMGLSDDGQVLMVATQDTARRANHEIIAYNARSGSTILEQPVDDAERVEIGSMGFAFPGQHLILSNESSLSGVAVYNSRDPFSIAEYQVDCSNSVGRVLVDDHEISIGVMEIDDEATNQGLALSDALASGFAQGGIRLVERSRIREVLEEIQLSTTGLTESQVAVDVGRLGVANYLVFGRASRSARNIAVSVRLVSVERGEVRASCSMICRDCENQDLYEGFLKLAEHWAG